MCPTSLRPSKIDDGTYQQSIFLRHLSVVPVVDPLSEDYIALRIPIF